MSDHNPNNDDLNTLNKLIKCYTGPPGYMGNRVPVIDIDKLESVLKKCPNISRVSLWVNSFGTELSVIGKYCPRLTALQCDPYWVTDEVFTEFGSNYGHKLVILQLWPTIFRNHRYVPHSLLKWCSNVKTIEFKFNNSFIVKDQEFLPKLEIIRYPFPIKPDELTKMDILAEKYHATLRILKLSLNDRQAVSPDFHNNALSYIPRFKNLISLDISLWGEKDSGFHRPIDESLSLIGRKCTKLKNLSIETDSDSLLSDLFFTVLSEFKSLEKLNIELEVTKTLVGSIDSLKHCSRLKYLSITYSKLTEDFFANIQSFLPKLQFLNISISKPLSKSFIDSLKSMQCLQKLTVKDLTKMKDNEHIYYFGNYRKKRSS